MEIDRTDFPAMLPTMLKHISNAHFVAFDLELSGIPTRQRNAGGGGRQTLQQRYTEVKRAAETFHILQFGLTCVEQDEQSEKYILRSYNFNLSPLIGDGLDVEREFTYSTGAVDFLLSVGYSMDSPFKDGVPYLTREETTAARKKAMEKSDRASIPDITIRPDDEKALKFMKRVRKEIDAWQKLPRADHPYWNVGGRMTPENFKLPLNGFEKRLTHQIVRAEYPDLQTYGTRDFVQVETKNVEKQVEEKAQLERRLDRSLSSAIGFRWLTEALAGESLAGLDLHAVPLKIEGEEQFYSVEAFTERVDAIKAVLAQRPRVLVGHNCFMDLVFIYNYFYGPLPDSVEEFQESLHAIFPTIVDTKYLSTVGPDALHFRNSQLSQIEEALADDEKPVFGYPTDHPRYLNSEKYHEAGFDSFITSKVFLRLASRLNAPPSAKLEPGTEAAAAPKPSENEQAGFAETPSAKKRRKLIGEDAPAKPALSTTRFSHANLYDALPDESSETPSAASTPTNSQSADRNTTNATPIQPLDSAKISELMPAWDTDFWQRYSNKLRVYGTQEEECDLTQKRKTIAAAEVAEEEKKEEDEGGVQLERRPSILSSTIDTLSAFWLGKK